MAAVIAGVVVSGIYFGRPVLMPLALAVLTSFALAPLVALLKRLRLGNVGAVVISLVLAVVVVSSLGLFMGSQLAKLAADLPPTRPTWRRRSIRWWAAPPITTPSAG